MLKKFSALAEPRYHGVNFRNMTKLVEGNKYSIQLYKSEASHEFPLVICGSVSELFKSPTSSTFPRPEAFLRRMRIVNRLDVNKLPVSLVGVIRLCSVCPLPDISQYSEDNSCAFFPY